MIREQQKTFSVESGKIICLERTQPAIKCSKLTVETLEQGVKHVQSYGVVLVSLFGCPYFTPCSSFSFVNYEQVNAGLGGLIKSSQEDVPVVKNWWL